MWKKHYVASKNFFKNVWRKALAILFDIRSISEISLCALTRDVDWSQLRSHDLRLSLDFHGSVISVFYEFSGCLLYCLPRFQRSVTHLLLPSLSEIKDF